MGLLNELRALGQQRPQDAPEQNTAAAEDAGDDMPAGPRIDLLSGGPNPSQYGRDLIDELSIRHGVERANAERDARDQSSTTFFEDWGKNDDKAKKEWAQGEKDYAQSREAYWSSVKAEVARRREHLRSQGDPYAETDPMLGFLERRTTSNIGEMQQRKAAADAILSGEAQGPQYGDTRAVADASLRGVMNFISDSIKDITYGAAYIAGEPLSKAQDTSLYKFAEFTDALSKAQFPEDPARAQEFKMMLAQGLGSMIGFMGPSIAARVVSGAGPQTLAKITGTLGALQQGGSMTDDAIKAMKEGKTVDGRPVDDDAVTAAFLLSIPIGASEALPLAHLFKDHMGHWLKAILVQAFEEGGQEFGQQIAENITARSIAKYDENRNWDDQAWDAAAVGAWAGLRRETPR